MNGRHIMILLFSIGISGCYFGEGPRGPRGYDGRDGIDGTDGEESFVFEYEFSFTSPDYSQLLLLPDDFVMLDSDVVMVYFLWEVAEDGVEIWRSLPQIMYLDNHELIYNFDFTKYDIRVFMNGTVNLNELGAVYTDHWIARVVVVPGKFAGRSTLDLSNYDEVQDYFDLSPSRLAKTTYLARP